MDNKRADKDRRRPQCTWRCIVMLYYYYRVIAVPAGWCKIRNASPGAGMLYEAFCIQSLKGSCISCSVVLTKKKKECLFLKSRGCTGR